MPLSNGRDDVFDSLPPTPPTDRELILAMLWAQVAMMTVVIGEQQKAGNFKVAAALLAVTDVVENLVLKETDRA